FKRHMQIAQGLLSEDDFLLTEILFNPYTPGQLTNIREKLKELLAIIETKDSERMKAYLKLVRENIR
ncbi:MAG: prephenate dehydrogenase/arogenate dehydrogenase family protein, partial [Proteiniphilum sp.]|nr:prephenate dehydrogenase/arogenate dehydrogenase family protein [Proteiniphilum sp.]